MKAIIMEFQKIRYRKIWLIVAVLISVQTLWAMWAVGRMREEVLKQGWMYCLYQFPLLNTIMMPIVAAVVASRLCDIEHKGSMFKLLYTAMPSGKLFWAKFFCGFVFMAAASGLQVVLMLLIGYGKGFGGEVPVGKLITYLFVTIAVNITILLFQQVLSLYFLNQMISLTVGLVGGFAGLFSLFFPGALKKALLWGYYGVMLTVGMDWNQETRIMNFYDMPIDTTGLVLLAIMFVGISIVGHIILKRKEI